MAALPLRADPDRRACRGVVRSVDRVDPQLWERFRLAAGGSKPWPLFLHGPAGGGKTCAALALLDLAGPRPPLDLTASPPADDWLAGFVAARTTTAVRIGCDQGRLSWSRAGCGTDAIPWEVLANAVFGRAPLVVLDDVGVGTATDFRVDVLLDLLDRRCGSPVRPLVVTSNLGPSEFEKATDDRLADRVLSGTILELSVGSRRMGGG